MTDTKKLELIKEIITETKLGNEYDYYYDLYKSYKGEEEEEEYKPIVDDLDKLFDLLYPDEEETKEL